MLLVHHTAPEGVLTEKFKDQINTFHP